MTAMFSKLVIRDGEPVVKPAGVSLAAVLGGARRVVFVDDPADVARAGRGDAVVMLGSIGRSLRTLLHVAARLEEAGASGLLVHERRLSDPISTSRGGFPVLLVDRHAEWADVLAPLLGLPDVAAAGDEDPATPGAGPRQAPQLVAPLANHADAWLEALDATLDDAAIAAVVALAEHDDLHSSNLVETLRVTLESRRMRDAAAALFLHRNTLRYRLDVIRRITGLDPRDPEGKLVLQLQTRLAVIRGVLEPREPRAAAAAPDFGHVSGR